MLVPAHVQDGHTEWTLATILSISLFYIAQGRHKLLNGNRFVVLQLISLSDDSQFICENIGIGCDAGNRAHHIFIQAIDLLGEDAVVEKLVDVASFGCQQDSIFSQDAETGSGV